MPRYYLYILSEHPPKRPYFCKVGITADPLRRLAELQQGNPRPLRSPDYQRKPDGVFGFPVPSESHARRLEQLVFEHCRKAGITLRGDVDYSTLSAPEREWVSGLHPDELYQLLIPVWRSSLTDSEMRSLAGGIVSDEERRSAEA